MSIKDLSGFNLGPVLGPIGNAPPVQSGGPQGILVREFVESTPLDPGYWRWRDDGTDIPLHGEDPPSNDPFPSVPIRTFPATESGGYVGGPNTGTLINIEYNPYSLPSSESPIGCPKCADSGTNPGHCSCDITVTSTAMISTADPVRGTRTENKGTISFNPWIAINQAINNIFNTIKWHKWLSQFSGYMRNDGNQIDLIQCMKNACTKITIDCEPRRKSEDCTADSISTGGGGNWFFCPSGIANSIYYSGLPITPNGLMSYMEHAMAFMLISECTGTTLDAYAITSFDGFIWPVLLGSNGFITNGISPVSYEGKDRYAGKYIWWEPATGKIGYNDSADELLPIPKNVIRRAWIGRR